MKKSLSFVTMLVVLTVLVASLALAQEDPSEEGDAGIGSFQYDATQTPNVTPGIPEVCDHFPGEFVVGYVSEEAMRTAPQQNVKRTARTAYIFPVQVLYFDYIAAIPDPDERFAAEEAKRQELSSWPGVEYAEYNCKAYLAG